MLFTKCCAKRKIILASALKILWKNEYLLLAMIFFASLSNHARCKVKTFKISFILCSFKNCILLSILAYIHITVNRCFSRNAVQKKNYTGQCFKKTMKKRVFDAFTNIFCKSFMYLYKAYTLKLRVNWFYDACMDIQIVKALPYYANQEI